MRAVLVKPSWKYPITRSEHTYNRRWPPLELLNVAAILEGQGHDVRVIDAHAEGLSPRRLADRVGRADMVLLSTSGLDRWQCPNLELAPIEAAARGLRDRTERLYITGFHGTVEPEAMLRLTGADAVIRGEPEEASRDLGAGCPVEQTEGFSFLRGGRLVSTPDRPKVDVTQLPPPAFHLLDIHRYQYEVLGPRFAVLEGARGCPYPCTFCSRTLQGRPLRRKHVEQLGHEVELAVRKHGIRNVYFIDLEFTATPEIAEGISKYLLKHRLPLRWCCQTRTDKVDEPLLRLMKAAGCRLIHFGVETGSPRLLEHMRKHLTLADQRAGVRLAQKVGLDVLCFFLLGYPGETVAEMRQTMALARELNPTYASFHRISPYHGTALFDAYEGRNGLFPEYHGSAEEQRQVDGLVREALWTYYVRPRYMVERLLRGSPQSLWGQLRLFAGYFGGN